MQAIETRFLEGLLRNSWQAAVLVGIVLGVQAVMGRRLTAFWRHALWWVVVVRLLVPAVGDSRAWLAGRSVADRCWREGCSPFRRMAIPSRRR